MRALILLWLFKRTKKLVFWHWFLKCDFQNRMDAHDRLSDGTLWIHRALDE